MAAMERREEEIGNTPEERGVSLRPSVYFGNQSTCSGGSCRIHG